MSLPRDTYEAVAQATYRTLADLPPQAVSFDWRPVTMPLTYI